MEHAEGHLLVVSGVTFDHLVGRLKICIGNISYALLLARDHAGIGHCSQLEWMLLSMWIGVKVEGNPRYVPMKMQMEKK